MATHVYLKEDDTRLAEKGFRWCKKDCRWESKRNPKVEEAQDLADEIKTTVFVEKKATLSIYHSKER